MELIIFAYLDPATGAIVLQVIIAAVITAGLTFRKVVSWPFRLLRRKRPESNLDTDVE